ncbi:unnamed protein product, partial [Ectocarpus fasciculatus]
AASALDVTWDVLDADGYPELTPRRRRELFPVAETEAERHSPPVVRQARGGGGGGGGGRGGRTDRVVDMLASLEKAVMDVCKDMWRLEDKVEGSERYTASRGSERVMESSVAVGEGLGGEVDQGIDGVGVDDGREEVAAQVEAYLSKMWRDAPEDPSDGDAGDGSSIGRVGNAAPSHGQERGDDQDDQEEQEDQEEEEEQEEQEEQEIGIHAALLLGDD